MVKIKGANNTNKIHETEIKTEDSSVISCQGETLQTIENAIEALTDMNKRLESYIKCNYKD